MLHIAGHAWISMFLQQPTGLHEKWVTVSFFGHTAVCLKNEMGNLWFGESGPENEKVST
jgi:hypothetical protein